MKRKYEQPKSGYHMPPNSAWIKGYEGRYAVDRNGNVWSSHYLNSPVELWRKLKLSKSRGGYWLVTLCDGGKTKTFSVHRLIAAAFIPNDGGRPCVNHINFDRSDNRASNLEWATQSENMQWSASNGAFCGEENPNSSLTEMQVSVIRGIRKAAGIAFQELGNAFGVSKEQARRICRGLRWKGASA